MRSLTKIFTAAYLANSMKNCIDSQLPTNEIDQQQLSEIKTSINKIFLTSQPLQSFNFKIFAFDAEILAKQITSHLDITLGRRINSRFNDGQINIQLLEHVRDQHIFLIKSFQNKNINDGIMELLLAISCMKKEGAKTVTAIIPFLPYSEINRDQNLVNEGDDFSTCFASDLVKLMEDCGCDTIITLNSLMSHPKGFAQKSCFININAPQLVVPLLLKKTNFEDPVIISSRANPIHFHHIDMLKKTFKLFGCQSQLGFFNQDNYIGNDVRNKDVLLYNNLVRTGKTMTKQVKYLKKQGARNIYYFGFHGMCLGDNFGKIIDEIPLEQLIITNSIFHADQNKKIRTVSIAKLLAELITLMAEEKSLREYRGERQLWNYAIMSKLRKVKLNEKWNQSKVY